MNETAKDGQVFVCGACGKRSKDLYGYRKIDRGWDESCMLNAVLCWEEKRFGQDGILGWVAVTKEESKDR